MERRASAEDVALVHVLLVLGLKEAVRRVVSVGINRRERYLRQVANGNEDAEEEVELDDTIAEVRSLLETIELCLWHGLRPSVLGSQKGGGNPLLQMQHGRNSGSNSMEERHFWDYVLSMEAVNGSTFAPTIMLVRMNSKCTTSRGLCRAWIRQLLNQNALEFTLRALCKTMSTMGSKYYEEWAFLRLGNEPNRSMFFNLLGALNNIGFSLDVASASRLDAPAPQVPGAILTARAFLSSLSIESAVAASCSEMNTRNQTILIVSSEDFEVSGRYIFIEDGMYGNRTNGYQIKYGTWEQNGGLVGWGIYSPASAQSDIPLYFVVAKEESNMPLLGWRVASQSGVFKPPSMLKLNYPMGLRARLANDADFSKASLLRDEVQSLRVEIKQVLRFRQLLDESRKTGALPDDIVPKFKCPSPVKSKKASEENSIIHNNSNGHKNQIGEEEGGGENEEEEEMLVGDEQVIEEQQVVVEDEQQAKKPDQVQIQEDERATNLEASSTDQVVESFSSSEDTSEKATTQEQTSNPFVEEMESNEMEEETEEETDVKKLKSVGKGKKKKKKAKVVEIDEGMAEVSFNKRNTVKVVKAIHQFPTWDSTPSATEQDHNSEDRDQAKIQQEGETEDDEELKKKQEQDRLDELARQEEEMLAQYEREQEELKEQKRLDELARQEEEMLAEYEREQTELKAKKERQAELARQEEEALAEYEREQEELKAQNEREEELARQEEELFAEYEREQEMLKAKKEQEELARQEEELLAEYERDQEELKAIQKEGPKFVESRHVRLESESSDVDAGFYTPPSSPFVGTGQNIPPPSEVPSVEEVANLVDDMQDELLKSMIRQYAKLEENSKDACKMAAEIFKFSNYVVGPMAKATTPGSDSRKSFFDQHILAYNESQHEDSSTEQEDDSKIQPLSPSMKDMYVKGAQVVGQYIHKGPDTHVRFVIRVTLTNKQREGRQRLRGDASILQGSGDDENEDDMETVCSQTTKEETKTITIQRRFKDFKGLQSDLRKTLPGIPLPQLPKTAWVRIFSEDYIEKKRVALDTYLQDLLSMEPFGEPLTEHTRVVDFLLHDTDLEADGQDATQNGKVPSEFGGLHISLITEPRPDPKLLESRDSEGLAAQDFKCASCAGNISVAMGNKSGKLSLFRQSSNETRPRKSARFCSYTERWFCPNCYLFARPDIDADLLEELEEEGGDGGDRATLPSPTNSRASNMTLMQQSDGALSAAEEYKRMLPTRILHHWDFELYHVSAAAALFLDSVFQHPVICVSAESPKLFSEVGALQHARLLRLQLSHARESVESCPRLQSKTSVISPALGHRTHLAQDTELYSISDLYEMRQGNLIPVIMSAVEQLANHITSDCDLCKAKGYMCEICESEDVIYPFQIMTVVQCRKCKSYFHRNCFAEVGGEDKCPKCLRQKR